MPERKFQQSIQFIEVDGEAFMRLFANNETIDYVIRPTQITVLIEQLAHILPAFKDRWGL